MKTEVARRKRQQERRIHDRATAVDRYVDIGVILCTVVADPDGEELIKGKPKLRITKRQRFGGTIDTKANPPRHVGPSHRPVIWYVSEDQEPVVMHADTEPLGELVYGSEGAGKTTAMVIWHYFRWLENLGFYREGGQTAPTKARLKMFRDELFRMFPRSWYHHRVADDVIVLCDGTRIQLKSTKQQSKESGSPIQGFNWAWCGRDEGQDQIDRHEDIEARGRSAPNGRYKQMITATAKDSPAWRDFRDTLLASELHFEHCEIKQGAPKCKCPKTKLWKKHTLLGRRSPFVFATFWDMKLASMTEREYQRRVLAMDVPAERVLYNTFERALNVIPLPVTARDITNIETRELGGDVVILTGHDPGKLFDVSVLLKAFRVPNCPRPVWFVVDEVTTEQSTTEVHVKKLLDLVGAKYNCNLRDRHGRLVGPRIAVRADPYGDTGNDENRPDVTVYKVFRNHGITIKPAAYAANANKIVVKRVPKEARIDMVSTLFRAASGERRLFVLRNDRGQPVAPKLVEALETMERDSDGRAETQAKDKNDKSHWPAALGYALWAIEKPRIDAMRSAA